LCCLIDAELTVDDCDAVHGELQADGLVLERMVADIEHQVCVVWSFQANLGIGCRDLRVWGRVFVTAANSKHACGESESNQGTVPDVA